LLRTGDKYISLEDITINCGPLVHCWTKGRIYTIIYVDIDGFVLSCDLDDAGWFENEDWYIDMYCDKFSSLKIIRKLKLEALCSK
jgi:hypothetical protein